MITISDHSIRILHFNKIIKVSLTEIHIKMKKLDVFISGENLIIAFLNKDEIVLKGIIQKVDFDYHERI